MNVVAFVPARAGSERVPNKNIRILAGKPLLAWSVRAALDSGVFSRVICVTDSEDIADVAKLAGAETLVEPPIKDHGLDIRWVSWALNDKAVRCDAFSILRPTSPFRTAETIRRAWAQFSQDSWCDSLRAVEPVRQNPYKMWRVYGYRMTPLLEGTTEGEYRGYAPLHSAPSQLAPKVYVQNGSLEIAHARVVGWGSIAGHKVAAFRTEGHEGLNIDTPEDWARAVLLAETCLPTSSG